LLATAVCLPGEYSKRWANWEGVFKAAPTIPAETPGRHRPSGADGARDADSRRSRPEGHATGPGAGRGRTNVEAAARMAAIRTLLAASAHVRLRCVPGR
jgi:hypothetical protein